MGGVIERDSRISRASSTLMPDHMSDAHIAFSAVALLWIPAVVTLYGVCHWIDLLHHERADCDHGNNAELTVPFCSTSMTRW